MSLLLGCALAHLAAARFLASPWWVPDLTLVGLVLAVWYRPERWLLYAVTAGLLMLIWAVRFPVPVFLAYAGCGTLVRLAVGQLTVMDDRFQVLVTTILEAGLTGIFLWLEALWSLPLVGFALGRVALTGLSVLVVTRLTTQRTVFS